MTLEALHKEIEIADVKIVSWTKEKTERFGFTFPEDAGQNAVFAIALDKNGNILEAEHWPDFDSSEYIGDRVYRNIMNEQVADFYGFTRPGE